MRFCLLFLITFFCSGCFKVSEKIEPKIDYQVEENHLKSLTSPFLPLSEEEKATSWGTELWIAYGFEKKLDLYRALFSFQRAELLIAPQKNPSRKMEIQYQILLCYYFGKKYHEVIESFENSDLYYVDKTFPTYHDLLVILYDSYKNLKENEKAKKMNELIEQSFSGTSEKLALASALLKVDFPQIEKIAKTPPPREYVTQFLSQYNQEKKSVRKAQMLNVILPGAGYFYIGQKRTALTALLVNGLFIAAAYEFFHHGYTAAGIVTTSFEMGWYFGGIYGAGESAKFYNEKIYASKASAVMNQHGLFPIFMIQYGF